MKKRLRKKQDRKKQLKIKRVIAWVDAAYEKIDRRIKADPEGMKLFFLKEPKSGTVDLLIKKCEREMRKKTKDDSM